MIEEKEKFLSLLSRWHSDIAICSFYHHACTFKSFKELDAYCEVNKEKIIPWYLEYLCSKPSMIIMFYFSSIVKKNLKGKKIGSTGIVAYDSHSCFFSVIKFGIDEKYISKDLVNQKMDKKLLVKFEEFINESEKRNKNELN